MQWLTLNQLQVILTKTKDHVIDSKNNTVFTHLGYTYLLIDTECNQVEKQELKDTWKETK